MEGETMLIALVGAVVVAYLITKFGSRQPTEYRPRHSGDESDDTEDADSSATRRRRPGVGHRRPGADASGEQSSARPKGAARTTVDAELLRTLEELAAHPQNRAAAVNLLRQRTGMSARQARRFINAL